MQHSFGMLEGCRRRLWQVFDENRRAQALKQGSCLLSTCIFQEAQFYRQTLSRTKYAISSRPLSQRLNARESSNAGRVHKISVSNV